jgi:hypothetical protein
VVYNGAKWRVRTPDEMDLTSGKAEIDADELEYPPVGASLVARLSRRVWG